VLLLGVGTADCGVKLVSSELDGDVKAMASDAGVKVMVSEGDREAVDSVTLDERLTSIWQEHEVNELKVYMFISRLSHQPCEQPAQV
jgi:hypothetical protein